MNKMYLSIAMLMVGSIATKSLAVVTVTVSKPADGMISVSMDVGDTYTPQNPEEHPEAGFWNSIRFFTPDGKGAACVTLEGITRTGVKGNDTFKQGWHFTGKRGALTKVGVTRWAPAIKGQSQQWEAFFDYTFTVREPAPSTPTK